jgi:GntR family transcriptional regulator, transcriptional repressor for pyruvate dehydrogenase complex
MNVKLKKESLGHQLSEVLKKNILEQRWAVGEKISSEHELAEQFGVSRLTVRLALQKLVALGLLETRVGDGTYVKEFNFEWYIGEISNIVMKPEMLKDVQEFRRTIELACGKLIIENASDERISELEPYSKRFEEFVLDPSVNMETHLNNYALIDYDFHYKLCELSNNSLYLLAFSTAKAPIVQFLKNIIKSRWDDYFKKTKSPKATGIKLPTKSHSQIVQALKDRDFEGFKNIYFNLINYEKTEFYDEFTFPS